MKSVARPVRTVRDEPPEQVGLNDRIVFGGIDPGTGIPFPWAKNTPEKAAEVLGDDRVVPLILRPLRPFTKRGVR